MMFRQFSGFFFFDLLCRASWWWKEVSSQRAEVSKRKKSATLCAFASISALHVVFRFFKEANT